MGRPLRRHEPGAYHLVTTRCHQARFLLRPDRAINGAVLEWLSRAQQRWPRVLILGVCVMSNHLHLLVRDTEGELADWASYLLGNLARATNRIRSRSGAVFARRYSAEPVLDEEALRDRLIYVITNPVQAALCDRSAEWPGVSLWSRSGEIERHVVPAGGRRAEAAPVVIHPLPPDVAADVERDVREVESQLRAERSRRGIAVLGRARVLSQRWHERSSRPKRSPRPLCHASDQSVRERFAEGFRNFVDAFRAASAQLRSGVPEVSFPPWSYPPGQPMVRAAVT